MEKFLSIPVLDIGGTKAHNQLVSVVGIRNIGQPDNTSATIKYVNGETITLTWPASPTYASPILQEELQTAVQRALASGWTNVVEQYNPKGFIANPDPLLADEPTNPLATIAIT